MTVSECHCMNEHSVFPFHSRRYSSCPWRVCKCSVTMYWLTWHLSCHDVKDIAGAPYKIKKRQKPRKSVVAGRQQLYCEVQSWSPNHRRITTEKVQQTAVNELGNLIIDCKREAQCVSLMTLNMLASWRAIPITDCTTHLGNWKSSGRLLHPADTVAVFISSVSAWRLGSKLMLLNS